MEQLLAQRMNYAYYRCKSLKVGGGVLENCSAARPQSPADLPYYILYTMNISQLT